MSSKITILSKTRVVKNTKSTYYRISHESTSTNVTMKFGLFLPSSHSYIDNETFTNSSKIPVLYWLSGLTCDDTNFPIKCGPMAFEEAEKHQIAIVMPDTSPRNNKSIPNDDAYDLGIGAGFYVNATVKPWSDYYHMYTYVTKELPALLIDHFGLCKKSISGHSMGGHGAMTIAFKNIQEFTSVSALAPICHSTDCPWGEKIFKTYFGSIEPGVEHDATLLMKKYSLEIKEKFDEILIDQGLSDSFLENQLKPDKLIQIAKENEVNVNYRAQDGFDHGLFFVAAYIKDHVDFHAKYLNLTS